MALRPGVLRTGGYGYCAAIITAAMVGSAHAAVLEVAPVSIELAGGAQAAAITIISHDPAPVYVEVRGFAWTQSGNVDTLSPTDDLALAPPIFSLPQGTPQVVRVVLQQPPSDRERTYRLLIDEIPSHNGGTGVQFALRLSLPLFVEPASDIATRLRAHLQLLPNDQVALAIDNAGTRRARLVDLTLTTDAGVPVKFSSPPNPYVLAGAERHWTLRAPASQFPANTTLRMTVKTENGPFIARVGFAS